ncbi:uncharacterized protein LOC114259127 [Camellia sinensis]|uniref:uncharacterized protein LOC114259127 n=1 Tax=Camellia sinensis TaxID=4442 RepID=UPI0010358DBA|nr:uncharacterized protein LOC114259127 [Camellia sinensis]
MLQRSIQAIQHAHSFSIQSLENRKELADKRKEVASLQKANKSLQSKMKKLEDQAEAVIKAKDDTDEKAGAAEAINKVLEAQRKESEEKMAQAQKELQDVLATKDAELKAADEKGYNEGVADVIVDYEKQVKQAYNKGFTLGWMALLKKLEVSEDSPLRNADVIPLPFPPTPSKSNDESESEEETLVRKPKETAGIKSPSLNEQVLDLTQDEEGDEVPKEATPERASLGVPLANKSLDQTPQEIDAELAAEKAAEMSSQQSSEVQTQLAKEPEES